MSLCDVASVEAERTAPGYVAVVGCHGGAGASSLCQHLGSWTHDAGTQAPAYDGNPYLLVTRGTAWGAVRATELVRQLRGSTGMSLQVHLAVVSDGCGPVPTAARARLRNLRPYLDSVVHLPYVARWRYEDGPDSVESSRSYARAVRRIRSAVLGTTTASLKGFGS